MSYENLRKSQEYIIIRELAINYHLYIDVLSFHSK